MSIVNQDKPALMPSAAEELDLSPAVAYGRLKALEAHAELDVSSPRPACWLVRKGSAVAWLDQGGGKPRTHRVLVPGAAFETGNRAAGPLVVRALEATELVHFDGPALGSLMAHCMEVGTGLVVRARELLRSLENPGTSTQGTVLTVYGPVGGAGASTTALALASAGAEAGLSTLLVDLHPWFGTLAATCDRAGRTDLTALLAEPELGVDLLRNQAQADLPFDLIASPKRIEDGASVTPDGIRRLLDVAVLAYDLVVLDLPDNVDEVVLSVLERADWVSVILQASFTGLVAGRRVAELLDKLGLDAGKVDWVMNRFQPAAGLAKEWIGKALGRESYLVEEDDGRLVRRQNAGRMGSFSREDAEHPLLEIARRLIRNRVFRLSEVKPLARLPAAATVGNAVLKSVASGFLAVLAGTSA